MDKMNFDRKFSSSPEEAEAEAEAVRLQTLLNIRQIVHYIK
jgi:hypothetical protein